MSMYLEISPDIKSLHEAIKEGNCDAVAKILREKNVHPEAQDGHSSALAAAIAAGHGDIATKLLEAGAGVNFGGRSGRFPLYIAVHNGDLQLTKLLIEAGAVINLKYVTGNTALLEAAAKGHDELVPYLISVGADVQVSNNAGETGLHFAAARGHVQHLQFLIANGADVNAELKNGRTSLHIAASRGAVDIASLLLAHGCQVDPVSTENLEHKTPLLTAVDAGHLVVVELLIRAGADINFRDVQGFTPLLTAIFSGKVRIALALMRAGCNVNLRSDVNGLSPFKASLRHPPHMTQMLVMAGYKLGPDVYSELEEPLNNQLYNKNNDVRAWVLAQTTSPPSLQQQCRLTVRDCVKFGAGTMGEPPHSVREFRHLPLPRKVIDYLDLRDLDDILHAYINDFTDSVPGYVILETDS